MTENKRFELRFDTKTEQLGIIDWFESKSKNAICIYDGLGALHFSSAEKLCDLLNELNDENIELHIQNDFLKVENQHMRDLIIENKQLKQQIKDLRLGVLDSIHEAEEIQCCCNPCVVEECVKKVIE